MKKIKKSIALILVTLSLVGAFPIDAFAHDAFYLQVVVNESTNLLESSVVRDNSSFTNNEVKHIEPTHFSKEFIVAVRNNSNLLNESVSNLFSYVPTAGNMGASTALTSNDYFPFTFPGKEQKSYTPKNDGTTLDASRAVFVGSTLTNSLNEAIVFINGGVRPKSIEELFSLMRVLAPFSTGASATTYAGRYRISNLSLSGAELTKFNQSMANFDPDGGVVTASNFIQIKDNVTNVTKYFITKVDKGYKPRVSGGTTLPGLIVNDSGRNAHYSESIEKINWMHVANQAYVFYNVYKYTSLSNPEIKSISKVEQYFVDMAESLFTSLQNWLGLYSMNELVFNAGIRGTSNWWYGTMNNQWRDRAGIFHFIFQGFGASLLVLALILNLMKKTLASINPVVRADMMDTFQNLIIAGLLMTSLIPFFEIILRLNFYLTDLFLAFAEQGNMTSIGGYGTGIGGVFMTTVYFLLTLIFNATYIIRAISIAILFALAPIFVISIAFGGKKALFGNWIRELVANVFRQSFDAFFLSFFLSLTMGTRGIESLIVMFACIPVSRFVMTMITGGAGTLSSQLGLGAFALGAGAVASIGTKASESIRGAFGGSSEGYKSGNGNSSSDIGTGSMQGVSNGKDSTKLMTSGQGEGAETISQSPNSVGSTQSLLGLNSNSMAVSSDSKDGMLMSEKSKADLIYGNVDNTIKSTNTLTPQMDGTPTQKPQVSVGSLSDVRGNNIGASMKKAGLGLAKASFGAGGMISGGALMVAGGSDGAVANTGLRAFTGGFGDAFSGAGSMLGAGKDAFGDSSPTMSDLNNRVEDFYAGSKFDKDVGAWYSGDDASKNYLVMDSAFNESKLESGSVQVDHHLEAFYRNTGISDARMDGDNMILEYDLAGVSSADAENLRGLQTYASEMSQAPEVQRTEMMKHLNGQGVIDVSAVRDNKMKVVYNKEGANKLGVQKMYSQNGKMVEIKAPMHPRATSSTLNANGALGISSSSGAGQVNKQ